MWVWFQIPSKISDQNCNCHFEIAEFSHYWDFVDLAAGVLKVEKTFSSHFDEMMQFRTDVM